MRGDSMATVSSPRDPVTTDWPDWADDRIELGPCPSDEDARWWACHAPGNADDYDVEPDDVDERAALCAALDSLERSFLPNDLAEMISRTSLVGLADAILHEGSGAASCRCWSCIEIRTRHYAE